MCVFFLSFVNVNYILLKLKLKEEVRVILIRFKVLVEVFVFDDKILELFLNDDVFSDFEDVL